MFQQTKEKKEIPTLIITNNIASYTKSLFLLLSLSLTYKFSLTRIFTLPRTKVLDSLGTLDSHRKQGIGSALVRWGNAYADAHGLECYLQASPLGFGVYERLGYRKRDVTAAVGEQSRWVAMVRPAAGAAE